MTKLSFNVNTISDTHYNYLTLSYHFIIHEKVIKQHNWLQSKLFGPLQFPYAHIRFLNGLTLSSRKTLACSAWSVKTIYFAGTRPFSSFLGLLTSAIATFLISNPVRISAPSTSTGGNKRPLYEYGGE